MLDKFLDLFRESDEEEAPLEPVLAAAALLFEVAWADHDIEQVELDAMSAALTKIFSIEAARMNSIVEQTRLNHESSVGVFPFTQALNQSLSAEQKYQVLKAMWLVALSDNNIDRFEEHTIRRVADLLYVAHPIFIQAKHAAREEQL
ncbi:MAG: TerB family tellurite resistance protein [Gammaproteobacteria bacterium]|nr:TerB family tellurite resistance protein [Gammaproteobacteria bacterium]